MILENIKENKKSFGSFDLLRFLMAAIFLSAGIFRIFNPEAARIELRDLHLPYLLSYFLIIFEIGAGLFLLFDKYLKVVYRFLAVFLSLALIWGLVVNGRGIIGGAGELFIFRTNPIDFFMHLVFLVILISLIMKK